MITKEFVTLKIPLSTAQNIEAYKHGTYDNIKQELSFNVNHASKKKFRLVHDIKKAYVIVDGNEKNITSAIYDMKEFNTKEEALDKVEELGLEYDLSQEVDDILIDAKGKDE